MNQLKDTTYKQAKKYIRHALEQDFIDDVKKEHLITTYNELTETNAESKIKYVHALIDDDYARYDAKRKAKDEAFGQNFFITYIIIYVLISSGVLVIRWL